MDTFASRHPNIKPSAVSYLCVATPADTGFEELFVRVVPVEVCCIHSSSNGGSPNSAAMGGLNAPMKHTHCLRARTASHGSERYPESPSAAGMMPGTPTMNGSGLYPTLSSTELHTCFCPNCCSNSYTTAENSNPSQVGAAGEGLHASPSSAEAALAAVAIQRITVRVLAQKTRYGANGRLLPGCFKMELSSDSSLFFLFLSTINETTFLDIKVGTAAESLQAPLYPTPCSHCCSYM